MCVVIFIELCIMGNESVNFERLKIMLLKEHTTSFSLHQLHLYWWAVLIQSILLS